MGPEARCLEKGWFQWRNGAREKPEVKKWQ